jgi:hypothetical protein
MSTPRVRRACAAAGAAAAVLLAACADDPRVADVTTVAPPAAAPATSEAVEPSAPAATDPGTSTTDPTGPTGSGAGAGTAPAGETVGVSTTAVDVTVAGPATGPMFSDALGEQVTGAPGVRTPGDTRRLLPEGLYVHLAWTADPADPSVFTPTPDDIPILEAYANAAATFYRAALGDLTTDDPAFEALYTDGGAKFDATFLKAREGNYTKSLGRGVLLRPYVLADTRDATSVVVLDCSLSHEEWLVDGQAPADLEAPTQIGTAATLSQRDGSWIVDTVSAAGTACL